MDEQRTRVTEFCYSHGAMRKKDNLNRGQVYRSSFTSFYHAASIQSVCANNWPLCVYYLLSHLCRSLSSYSFATHGTCAFTVPLQLWQVTSELWFYSGGRDVVIAKKVWKRKIKQQCRRALWHLSQQCKKEKRHYAINVHIKHLSVVQRDVMSTCARVR